LFALKNLIRWTLLTFFGFDNLMSSTANVLKLRALFKIEYDKVQETFIVQPPSLNLNAYLAAVSLVLRRAFKPRVAPTAFQLGCCLCAAQCCKSDAAYYMSKRASLLHPVP
jgi:hypothetical protein